MLKNLVDKLKNIISSKKNDEEKNNSSEKSKTIEHNTEQALGDGQPLEENKDVTDVLNTSKKTKKTERKSSNKMKIIIAALVILYGVFEFIMPEITKKRKNVLPKINKKIKQELKIKKRPDVEIQLESSPQEIPIKNLEIEKDGKKVEKSENIQTEIETEIETETETKIEIEKKVTKSKNAPSPDIPIESNKKQNIIAEKSLKEKKEAPKKEKKVPKKKKAKKLTYKDFFFKSRFKEDQKISLNLLDQDLTMRPKIKSPKYISPPNYQKIGKGLVYNCKDKHWACINRDSFIKCAKNYAFHLANKKDQECVTIQVFKNNYDCRSAQKHKVNTASTTKFCK